MSLLVQKFGGTSLGDTDLIGRAADRVAEALTEGHQVVVVVSAMGHETDRLIELAKTFGETPDPRELDALMASGEQVSAALMALALRQRGLTARSWLGDQIPIVVDEAHGRARIIDIGTDRLRAALAAGEVPVIAGFQGVTVDGDIATLGRGGTDTTAVAIAAALDADECQIFTDVDGVYTTDPRRVAEARRLGRISGEEMLEMASQGSRVLLNRAVEYAGRHDVPLRVLPAHAPGQGTRVDFRTSLSEQPMVSGLTCDDDACEFRLSGLPDAVGVAYRVLRPLYDLGVDVDMIGQSPGEGDRVELGFTVPEDRRAEVEAALTEPLKALGLCQLDQRPEVSKLSVIGVGLRAHAGIASRLFDTLAREGVDVRRVTTSESRLSVLIDSADADRALAALHRAYGLGDAD